MTSTHTRAAARAATPGAATPAAGTPVNVGQVPFDGFPYLVTRIGRTPLRHLAVVPADWSRDQLVDLLCRQVDANQLDTCLCLGPADAVYVRPPGRPTPTPHIPTGIPVLDRIVIADPLPESPDLARRHAALVAYVTRNGATGHLVGDGLEGGTPATLEDVARLSGTGPDGLPPGLRRCGSCGQPRGEHLSMRGLDYDERNPRVVPVHCQCDNHNRCAGCGRPLADQRLSAWYWDEERAGAWYVAAYCGLSHRCDAVKPAVSDP